MKNDLINKIEDENADFEESILSLLLIHEKLIEKAITEKISSNFFLNPIYRIFFETIIKIFEETETNDILSIVNELKVKNVFENLGGDEAIEVLMNNQVYSENFDYYCKKIEENYKKYLLSNLIYEIYNDIYKNKKIEEITSKISRNLEIFSTVNLKKDYFKISHPLEDFYQNIIKENPKLTIGISSGIKKLDYFTNGFNPGDLIILAARPSMGKTALGLFFASYISGFERKKVLFFSLEMGANLLVSRIIAQVSKVKLSKIRSQFLNEYDLDEISTAVEMILENWDFYYSDNAGITLDEICRVAKKAHENENKIDLIVIDYLQLVSLRPQDNVESRLQEVSKISRSLKKLAMELNIPIIALSQLSRKVESREDKIPILSDLRESGTIEQDADLVIFLHRDDYYMKKSEKAEQGHEVSAEIIVAKNRNGPTGLINILFDKETGTFQEDQRFGRDENYQDFIKSGEEELLNNYNNFEDEDEDFLEDKN